MLVPAALLVLSLAAGLCHGAAGPPGDSSGALEVKGEKGAVVRVERDALCIEYGKEGPEAFTSFSLDGQPAQAEAVKVIAVASALREDPALRALVLSRSPLYAELLRRHAAAAWLLESPEIEQAIASQPQEEARLRAAQMVGAYLLGPEALQDAAQHAVWAVTGVTPERLLADQASALQRRQDRDRIIAGGSGAASGVELQLLAPYVYLLLTEVGIEDKSWAPSGSEQLPRTEEALADPMMQFLLDYLAAGQLLAAADACAREGHWGAAAAYYEEALTRPLSRSLSARVAWQLALAYDRIPDDQTSSDKDQTRQQLQTLLAHAAPPEQTLEPPGPTDAAADSTEPAARELAAAESALRRGEHLACLAHALQALDANPDPNETSHALRLQAEAELAMGDTAAAKQTLSSFLRAVAQLPPPEADLLGLKSDALIALLYLRRLEIQDEFRRLQQEALDKLRVGERDAGLALLDQAAALLPGYPRPDPAAATTASP